MNAKRICLVHFINHLAPGVAVFYNKLQLKSVFGYQIQAVLDKHFGFEIH